MTEFIVREAEESDIPNLVDMGALFFAESNFTTNNEYDPVQMAGTLGYMLFAEGNFVLVAHNEFGNMIGYIAFEITRLYSKRPMAQLFLFYVAPQYRNSAVGRFLLQNAINVAKENGAARFYAASTAGLDDGGKTNKTLLNLYKRYGFTELGCFVQKELG